MAQGNQTTQEVKPRPSLDYCRGFNDGFDRGVNQWTPYATFDALIGEKSRSRRLRCLAWGQGIVLTIIAFCFAWGRW